MEHSKNFEKYKKYYDAGFWTGEMLYNVYEKGKLTLAEYNEIVGADEFYKIRH